MFILDESEIYYMSDIRKLLEQDRLEFEADQKIKNLDNIVQALRNVNNPVSMSPLSGDRKPQIRF